ncbi:hypothetical protein UCD39_25090 [Nitrospirillum sp. BR 11752]|uniref:hypothetical protein n=1 Tax=Nitrospirillum sp. BR 11752 TaxID=3104293 RepID=UPI002EA68391|nr:hypothetical protein [Nitrospirillum sp. BR 11752]
MPVAALRILRVLALLLALMASLPAWADDEPDFGVSWAGIADSQLWLLSNRTHLFHVTENGNELVPEEIPSGVIVDMCVQGGQLVAVTAAEWQAHPWTVYRRVAGAWQVEGTVIAGDDHLQAMDCQTDSLKLLTTHRLIEIRSGRQNDLKLKGDLLENYNFNSHVDAVYGTTDRLWVGYNGGEWGGGLWRIDRTTGAVTKIKRKPSFMGPGVGPFLSPVNAVAPLPWRRLGKDGREQSGCLAVTIGKTYPEPSGEIGVVCGDVLTTLSKSPMDRAPDGRYESQTHEGPYTVPMYGLIADGDALLASGMDGLYRINADGKAAKIPTPTFKRVGDIEISFALPHVVVIRNPAPSPTNFWEPILVQR